MSWNGIMMAFVLIAFGVAGWGTYRDLNTSEHSVTADAYRPGQLSKAHAFLEQQCAACHTPNQGVLSSSCVSCHANNHALLQRQSTAFHANVTSCKECHPEHRGGATPPLLMDHLALAKLGADAKNSDAIKNQLVRNYLKSKHVEEMSSEIVPINSREPPLVSGLNCMSCHATRDKHQGLFGTSCLSCHGTQTWRIAEYKHPSPNSRECTQCHQAPPSHYMMHFEMVSQKISGKEHAKVNQCFLCHQTTSWNDIKGVGWYKHH